MKQSNYNIFVEKNDIIIGFNTMSNNLIAINKNLYKLFLDNLQCIENIRNINEKLLNTLIENGFIISNGKDELNELRLQNKEHCFNKHYDLVLIPTLDCNLKCWYCWETHIPDSKMSKDIQNRVKKHIISELKYNNIDSLNLEFFGGEPLLHFNEVVYPLCLSIKEIIEKKGKTFFSNFITNGSLIDKKMIPKLKELNPGFQITLDGCKSKHNKVRINKNDSKGTYNQIIRALYQISENLENSKINIRINFDDNTLRNIEELVYDIKDLDRKKVSIHLERVWQTRKNIKENNNLLQNAMLLLTANNFAVDYGNFIYRLCSCNTDRYRQVGINFDGKVYKCTGRPFVLENCDGELNKRGEIVWDSDKLANRLGRSTFELDMCRVCKLLPVCIGPCSQKCMENNWQNMNDQCTLKTFEMTVDDYVLFLFNNSYKANEINKEFSKV